MTPQWKHTPLNESQFSQRDTLSRELSINPAICELLIQRGVTTADEARCFFKPKLSELHDPFLMKDMDLAVARLNKAMGQKQRIMIYGDWDVDGTSSVSLVYKFLRSLYTNIDYYIPDRYDDGYGISFRGIDYAHETDVKLIIALDCGIKATDKIEYAKQVGIDFIVCDHHTTDDILPDAVAVLDPKREDCHYPYKHLSACGVGFKFMQAFAVSNGIDETKHLYPLLDLVAISIAADIVPITDENRILAYWGLRYINTNPCVGLQSVIDVCGLTEKEITISDIVFKIGPRINASGRMQTGREAVDLLICKDMATAREISERLNQYNENRKEIDQRITQEANELLNNNSKLLEKKSIVIYNREWHRGVIAIVASRLTEMYYRPSVVLTMANGLISGSARSVPGFDIYKAIDSCRDLLDSFGGHTYAAGLSMKEENLPQFIERYEEYVAKNITPVQMVAQVEIDMVIDFKDITPKFFHILKQFAPFGPGNAKPLFCTKRVYDYGTSRLVGKDQEHLKLELVDSHSENIMNGIAFGMYEHNEYIKGLNAFDICYTIEENNYGGNNQIQLLIREISPSD